MGTTLFHGNFDLSWKMHGNNAISREFLTCRWKCMGTAVFHLDFDLSLVCVTNFLLIRIPLKC